MYSAAMLSAKAVVGFPVSFAAGFLQARFQPATLLAATYVIQALVLFLLTKLQHGWHLVLIGGLFGLGTGLGHIMASVLIPDVFGTKHLGAISGTLNSG